MVQIEKAFAPGYDPALILATHHIKHYPDEASQTSRLSRKEQDAINNIVHGHESGYYYMLLGPKVSVLQKPGAKSGVRLNISGHRERHNDLGCDGSLPG